MPDFSEYAGARSEIDGQPIDDRIAPMFQQEWMRVPFAAELLGVDQSTLYKQTYKGQLDTLNVMPNMKLVSRAQILTWEPRPAGRQPKEDDEGSFDTD